MALFLALLPILVILILLIFRRTAADVAGLVGWAVISPAKLQNAAASIDRIGEEGQVLRTTFVISLIITAVCALLTLVWSL